MSGEFSLIPIERLGRWAVSEYEASRQIFGIHEDLFFRPRSDDPFRMERYGRILETPLGVAAGPHTQMAQNLIVAWLCGSRYLELKTVQTLDELSIARPCIDMEDEGYNCEWSQELKLDESFGEYLNAWILIHFLRQRLGLASGVADDPGFLFNMSVGYNMEGILKDNVQRFFAQVADCGEAKRARVEALAALYPEVRDLAIPDCMSDNITLSTMHGCPPHEIQQIGLYLIQEKKLHTTIKLNPTLLGPDELRRILNDELGFEAHVPDEAFGHDLKYPDAVSLIKTLRSAARESGVRFSLKLTNTLECVNHKTVFPPQEKMMYMSGRALHPISIRVANRLQTEFNGELDISFCAGVDTFNLPDVVAAGMRPITVCSDVLKPGGYARMTQYLAHLREAMEAEGATTLDAFAERRAARLGAAAEGKPAALANLQAYAARVTAVPDVQKGGKHGELIKTQRPLDPFDCVDAPCVVTCPTNQEIPLYIYHAGRGEYDEAMRVILRTNPFPLVCGMVCDHPCQLKCTRINYDSPLLIREIKRFVAEHAPAHTITLEPAPANGLKVAVVGAGPSGLSCAYFLALAGFEVEVHETKAIPGGMLADAIPSFRLTDEAIRHDIGMIERLGVRIVYNSPVDGAAFQAMRDRVDYVYLGLGAQGAKKLGLDGEDMAGCLDCLRFLADVRQGRPVALGHHVVVVGGGNSAIDAARTAHRLVGAQGQVTVLYRRTRREMPADAEEIEAMLVEGVKLAELAAPTALVGADGKVRAIAAERMTLGAPDESGRRRPVRVPDSGFEVACDSVISSIGQDVLCDFVDDPSLLVTDPTTGETRLAGVFAGGDQVRGPSSVVSAIGDGRRAAGNIERKAMQRLGRPFTRPQKEITEAERHRKRASREHGAHVPETDAGCRECFGLVTRTLTVDEARVEAQRCLYCDDVCDQCVTVCPNRANLGYGVRVGDYPVFTASRGNGAAVLEPSGTFRVSQPVQVLNVGDFCNECGNCDTFCPTSGAPYRLKPKFYLTEKSFGHETDGYHLAAGGTVLVARRGGLVERLTRHDDRLVYETDSLTATLDPTTLEVTGVAFKPAAGDDTVDLRHAVQMAVLLEGLRYAPFTA